MRSSTVMPSRPGATTAPNAGLAELGSVMTPVGVRRMCTARMHFGALGRRCSFHWAKSTPSLQIGAGECWLVSSMQPVPPVRGSCTLGSCVLPRVEWAIVPSGKHSALSSIVAWSLMVCGGRSVVSLHASNAAIPSSNAAYCKGGLWAQTRLSRPVTFCSRRERSMSPMSDDRYSDSFAAAGWRWHARMV